MAPRNSLHYVDFESKTLKSILKSPKLSNHWANPLGFNKEILSSTLIHKILPIKAWDDIIASGQVNFISDPLLEEKEGEKEETSKYSIALISYHLGEDVK